MEMNQTDHFESWLNQLDDLPNNPYLWVTQIAYELAIGVTQGFWITIIATEVMIGWRPLCVGEPRGALEEYVNIREKSVIFNNHDKEYNKFGVIVESLVLSGFLDSTRLSSRNKAWLTPKAFELLKYPQHMEVEHDQKT